MKFEIKSWLDASILFTIETESIKLAVEAAVSAGANLDGANLTRASLDGANLYGANLYGANLARANLDGANLYGASLDGANLYGANLARATLVFDGKKLTLVGERPVLSVGPLGSRKATMLSFLTDGGVYVKTGCFFNTLAKFSAAVKETHGDNNHAKEYKLAVSLIEQHAKIWGIKA